MGEHEKTFTVWDENDGDEAYGEEVKDRDPATAAQAYVELAIEAPKWVRVRLPDGSIREYKVEVRVAVTEDVEAYPDLQLGEMQRG